MARIRGWFLAVLIALFPKDYVHGAQLRKINEVGHRPIHGFFCGDQTTEIYLAVCYGYHYDESKTHRSVMVDEKEANNFLHRLRRSSSSTNIVEECCIEGCHMEEVREYC
ncbi:unnamed protein product [Porites evermanni]|uniref:Insulin-like domain-containing protein n=1 Tax=Porites evermanni TaxID=104178 RepID=A0ABN8LH15_9CNID|nr:unnamed protein product [Porites evermanni]